MTTPGIPSDIPEDKSTVNNIDSLFPEETRLLMATLTISRMGGINVAECEHLGLQNALFDYFRQRLADNQICLYPLEITADNLNLANSLAELSNDPTIKNLITTGQCKSIVFFVHSLEKLSLPDRNQFLRLLNLLQDRFTKIAYPVVIWARPDLITQMIQHAPDFWLRKGSVYSFPAEAYEAIKAQEKSTSGHFLTIHRYLNAMLDDPTYTAWRNLYFPLNALRLSETANLVPARHTFTEPELKQLITLFPDEMVDTKADQTIIKRGELDDSFHVLLEGEVEVLIPDALGHEVVISHLSRGDFFGEIALIQNVPRTATVRSLTPCRHLRLTKPTLRAAASQITHLFTLMSAVAERRSKALDRSPPDIMSPLRQFATNDHPLSAPTDLFELIDENKKTMLLGETGSGKTTTLQALTLELLEKGRTALAQNQPVRLPIFISLQSLTKSKTIEDLILETFQAYGLIRFETRADIQHFLQSCEQAPFPIAEFVFLIDDLNDWKVSQTKDQTTNLETLNHFIQTYTNQQFIVTCRTQDYIALRDFKAVLLQNLTEREIEAFLIKHIGREQGKKVAREIANDQHLIELAQTPLALYVLIQITKKGTRPLPKNRGVLFHQFIDNLLQRTDPTKPTNVIQARSEPPQETKKEILAHLGLAMQKEQASTYTEEKWLNLLPHHLLVEHPALSQQTIFDYLKAGSLIRRPRDTEKDQIEFTHPIYQEFFAALALRDQNLPLEEYLAPETTLRHWNSVIILLYGISANRIALFSQILGQENTHARIWLAAQCLASSGQEIAVATERFERDLPAAQHFALIFSVGLASYLIRRYPEALSYLLQASEERAGNAEVQYELGSLYRQVGQYERAITHLVSAIYLRPDFVDAYNQLGITYYNQKKYEEALTVFLTTTQLEPANAHHYYNLGTVQKVLKDYQAARQTLQLAVQYKEDYIEAHIQLDLLERAFSAGVVSVLKSIPMLSKLTLEQTIMLANRLNMVEYKAGQIVFHMGEKGDTFYIIEYGSVEVLAPNRQPRPGYNQAGPNRSDRQSPVISNLQAGDFFGEIALLRSLPRTVTIRCTTDTRLLELSRDDFTDIIDHYPSTAYRLAETSRYRFTDDQKAGRQINPYYNFNYLQHLLDQQAEVTVLMGDIHGSTFLTNSIGPELMVAFLDEYLLRMSRIIVNAGGAVDKSLGDSVMGVFGHFPERSGETPASPAVRSLLAALQMRQTYLDLREEWKSKSHIFMQTGMGVGINTGQVTIGTVGAEQSMVGAAVNISNKLSKMAIKGRDESEIYIDEKTYYMLSHAIEVETLDPSYVVAKSGGVELTVYRVVRNINLKLDTDNRF